MKKITILLIFFLIALRIVPQNYTDSLNYLRFHRGEKDSMFYEQLYGYLKKVTYTDPDTALFYLNKYLTAETDTSRFRGVGLSYLIKGIIYKNKGYYDKAIQVNDSALSYFRAIDFKVGESAIYNNNGIVYKRKRKFKNALESFTKSLEVKKHYAKPVQLLATYNNIGLVYFHLKDYELAEEYYKRNLEIAGKNNLSGKVASAYNNLGNIYYKRFNNVKALSYYLKADSAINAESDKFLHSTIIGNLGLTYEALENYQKALNYFDKALRISLELDDIDTKILALRGLMRISFKLGDKRSYEKYFDQVWNLCEENEDYWNLASISSFLYSSFKEEKDYRKSLHFLELFHEYYDSTHQIEKTKELLRLKEQFESEQQVQQIKLLEKENKLQATLLEKEKETQAKKRLQILILIILAILLIVVSIWLLYRNKMKRRINMELSNQYRMIKEQQEEIKIQNEELTKANKLKDKMFQIISHDLRSPLIALNDVARLIPYYLEEENYQSIHQLSSTLSTSVTRILALVDNLLAWSMSQYGKVPYKPENISLREAGEEIVEIYQNLAQLKKINLQNKINPNIIAYADRHILLTVLRNLVNNSLKFTPEGGEVKLDAMVNSEVKVWVEDNGIGMTKEQIEHVFHMNAEMESGRNSKGGTGLGLFFSKEFVKINKGDIMIQSEKDKGTVVIFTLPKSLVEG